MSRSPSFRFYASDFLGSPAVQLMDAAEVGAYMLLLCVAWEGDRHGYLPDEDDKLRRWSRLTREQWAQSRDLILSKFPVAEIGWRANPRMVLEADKAAAFSESQSLKGRKGGRGNKKPELSGLKPELSPGKPELQKTKPAVAVAVAKDKDSPKAICEEFVRIWNEERGPLPEVLKATDSRAAKLSTRRAEGLTVAIWKQVIVACKATPFLRGEGQRRWRVSFDYLIENDTHITEVLEGKHGPAIPQLSPPKPFVEPGDLYRSNEYKDRGAA